MESSQSNFNLRLPGSYLVQSYLITTLTQRSVHPTAQFCLAKIQKMRSVMTASISQILEPSLQGLISSVNKSKVSLVVVMKWIVTPFDCFQVALSLIFSEFSSKCSV